VNVPINHPGKCVSPILFRLLMAALLIATGWPAIASAQAVLEISSPRERHDGDARANRAA
jgi:hypothetical protein